VQYFRRKALLFPQQSEQQVLRADVLVIQPLRFLRAIRQHALALVAQRQVDRSRYLLANRGVPFNLLPNGIDSRMRPQEPVGELLVLPQESEQKMLRLDVGTTELTRLIPGEEDDAPRFFRITLEHWLWVLPLPHSLYILKILSRMF
jgi:hypothetical protein